MTTRLTAAAFLATTALPLSAAQAQHPPAPSAHPPAAPGGHSPAPSAHLPAAPGGDPPAATVAEVGEEDDIVVVGQRARGSALGDIPPEAILTSRDIRATGATTIGELLEAVSAQTASSRGRGGGMPVILVNGMRTSSFREVHDIPPEAISRMEILPEEVALKYGYGADQKVVNMVLRRRFNSKNADATVKVATEGGYQATTLRGSRFEVGDDRRLTLGFELAGNGDLRESERSILLRPIETEDGAIDPRGYRSLVGKARSARATSVFALPISETTGLTLTGEAQLKRGRSLFGVPVETLDIAAANPFFADTGPELVRGFESWGALARDTRGLSLGTSANANGTLTGRWRWNAIANAEYDRNRSSADRGPDLSLIQEALDDLDPALDPRGDLGLLVDLPRDRASSTRVLLATDNSFAGPLFAAPGGEATAVVKLGASTVSLDSQGSLGGARFDSDLDRTTGEGALSIDFPLSENTGALGRISANANAAVRKISDFGALTTFGAGVSWSPTTKFNAIASWTREEGAPSIQQLGDPLLETPNVPYYDFVRGETALVTTLTGGNPDLDADRRNVIKLGFTWKLPTDADLRLRTDFTHATINSPIGSLPAASPALEAAFPDRFSRDADGRLIAVDLRPVNYEQARSTNLTWGIQFSKPLSTSPPSQETIDRMRERMTQMMKARGITPPPPPADGNSPAAPPNVQMNDEVAIMHGAPGGGPPGGGNMMMRSVGGGGRGGGRLTFGLNHTIAFEDTIDLGPGLPKLDYLDGAAYGPAGGKPRHTVKLDAGYFRNGLGLRADVDWRSATRVDSLNGPIRFDSYADVDLRLFANFGEQLGLIMRYPFLMGSSLRLEVNNLFNARPKVRDALGEIPFSYQPGQIEPIGRYVGISFRKLFIPLRFASFRGAGGPPRTGE